MTKPKNRKGRSSESTIRKRCSDILPLVIDGLPPRFIHQFVREKLSWDCDAWTLARYIKRCERSFAEESAEKSQQAKAQGILRLERLYSRAAQKGDLRTALSIEESILRLNGELDDRPQVTNLFITQEWTQALQVVLVALERYPEARIAVADRLAELKS